jgi:oxygen-dependent protoporphyrinogen oxidase
MGKSIVVIGGGIGGLTAAYRLRQLQGDASITILEASDRCGGVIQTSVENGCVFEHGPDSIIRAKPAGIALIRELGLEGEIQAVEPAARHGLIARGRKLIPIPDGFRLLAPAKIGAFLCSPLLSMRGKLRLLCDLIIARRPAEAPEETLAQFVRRRFGHEALVRIAQPLLSGIYTADPEQLSLSATMPQFIEMEREHGSVIRALKKQADPGDDASGPRYGMFLSLRGGLERLVDRLCERLLSCSVRVHAGVASIERDGRAFVVACHDRTRHRADQIVIAAPANAAAKMCHYLDNELCNELNAIRYAGVATVNLVFARSQLRSLPDAAGFVVPAIEGRFIIACTFASKKYADRAPDDKVMLRAFVGGAQHEHRLRESDDVIVANALKELSDFLGIDGDPEIARVHRWPASMAQYLIGHRERVRRIRAREARIAGFALIGNGYEGVGIPDIIAQAEAAAKRLSGVA